jgi:membrane protease YdiL (CAAX protease family)
MTEHDTPTPDSNGAAEAERRRAWYWWSWYEGTGGAASAAPPVPPRRPDGVFAADPAARPGDVPWGWRQVLWAFLIAAAPILALYAVVLIQQLLNPDQKATDIPEGETWFTAVLVALTIAQDAWFLLWSWMFSLRRGRALGASWGLGRFRLRYLLLIPVGLVPVYVTSGFWNALVHPPPQDLPKYFAHTTTGLIMFAVLGVLVAPFFEELVFRGFLFQGLARSWGVVPGLIVSAALFAIVHGEPWSFIELFEVALVLGALYYLTRSLWTSIAFHAVFNGVSVLAWWFLT